MKKIGNYLALMFMMILLCGCEKTNVSPEKELENVQYNQENVDYLDKALEEKNFDYSNYYLQCSDKSQIIGDTYNGSYEAYYFDKNGNTRKICYKNTRFTASSPIREIINCDIEITDLTINVQKISSSQLCELYYYKDELETKNDYDINEYSNIKKISNEYISLLNDFNIKYSYIRYAISNYVDGDYKTVIVVLNENEQITLKFDKNENLMLISVNCHSSGLANYEQVRLATIQYDYFQFSGNEQELIKSIFNDSKEITIRDFEISDSNLHIFSIKDIRY